MISDKRDYTLRNHGWIVMVFPLIATMLLTLFLAYHIGRLRNRVAALEAQTKAQATALP